MNPLRSILLTASESRFLAERVPRLPFVRRSVRRFMPGERLEDALAAAEALAKAGMPTVVTLLGEAVRDGEQAAGVAAHYAGVLETIAARGLPTEISVKPTHLGLEIDAPAMRERLVRLARAAEEAGSFLWIDMEQSRWVDATLAAYRAALGATARVGICLQANLRRTIGDVEALLPHGPSIRLVKGAYREPPALAWQRASEIDAAYLNLAERLLAERRDGRVGRLGVATHDPHMVAQVARAAGRLGVGEEAWEVQMLYGIRTDGARALVGQGRPVRILISYGDAWFPWFVRRLAERPANLALLARNLVAGPS